MDRFVNLHCHSEYSLLDGMPTVDDYVQWAVNNDQPAIAITDHGAMGSAYQLITKSKAAGIKGIVGIEAYIVPHVDKREPGESRSHVTLLATSWRGVQNLFRLSSRGWVEGFYSKPRIEPSWLRENSEDVICLSGCMDTMFGKAKNPLKLGEQLLGIFGDRLYMEIMPTALKAEGADQTRINQISYHVSQELGIPMVATPDSHYMPEWQPLHKVYLGIGSRGKMWEFGDTCFHPMTRGRMELLLARNHPYIPMEDRVLACEATLDIADRVDIEMPHWHNLTPQPYPGLTDDEEYDLLCKYAYEGLAKPKWDGKRYLPEYQERLSYELEYIRDREFTRYFLLVHNLFDEFIIPSGIMYGPGRGSSAGSLVCACLGITDPDPIEHDLMFERFLAVSRVEPPDIDMDFEDARRHEIKEWLIKKYGQENVASVGNYGTLGGKMVMQDVGKCLGVPMTEVRKVSALVTDDSPVEQVLTETNIGASLCNQYPQFKQACILMANRRRHQGIHASAVILSPFPLTDAMPLFTREGTVCTALDGKECGKMGFLKLDVLGIKTLSIIREACELSGVTHQDLLNLTYDDPEIFDEFHRGNTSGVFQYTSPGMTNLLCDMPVESFEDLVAANALYRPGAMRSGMFADYVERRCGRAEVKPLHPIYDDITKDTEGILVYQEQIMLIFGRLGGYDPAGVERMRQMIKDMPGAEVFNRELESFVSGAVSNGMSDYDARNLFHDMIHFGSYAFNKSHAWVYSQIGYWCMHFKHYYPTEWYCAIMNCEREDSKFRAAMADAVSSGTRVFLPDLNHSGEHARIVTSKSGRRAIKLGLGHIRRVGDKVITDLVEHAPYADWDDLEARVTKRVVNKTVRSTIQELGMLGSPTRSWDSDYTTWKQYYPLPVTREAIEAVDATVSYMEYNWSDIGSLEDKSGSVFLRGIIVGVKKKTFNGRKSATVTLDDSTGTIDVKCDQTMLEQFGSTLKDGNTFVCRVSKPKDGNVAYAKRIIVIDEKETKNEQ